MGVSLKLVNFNKLFFKASTRTPYIVNDIKESTEADKKALNKLIYTTYATDLLSNLPTCECGEGTGLVGVHNIGVICPNCNSPVTSPLEQNLESVVWMRAPEGVESFINPVVWTMLQKKFSKSGFEIIRWFCDTTYKTHVKTPALIAQLQALEIPRGYNNFIQNFDHITNILFGLKDFRPKKRKGFKTNKETLDPLQILLRDYRDCVFCQYLPLPNRSLLVIEETNVGTYVDPIVIGAVDAIRTMVSIDSELSAHTIRTKENKTVKTISQLALFYDGLYKTTLAKKDGIFRKHVYGTRSHFSFRAVISSLTDEHDYDELHIPWGIGVTVFRIHLMNLLLKKGYTPNTAIGLLNEHINKYSLFFDDMFQQLIRESPEKGICCILQRNPSLERGSAQAMFITKVKTDPNIPTVSLSILSVSGFNADFDGKVMTLPSLNFFNCWKLLRV